MRYFGSSISRKLAGSTLVTPNLKVLFLQIIRQKGRFCDNNLITPDQLVPTSHSRMHTISSMLIGRLLNARPLQKDSRRRAMRPSRSSWMLVPQTEWNFSRGFGRPRVPRLIVFSSYSDINSAEMLDCGPESGFGFYQIEKCFTCSASSCVLCVPHCFTGFNFFSILFPN